MLLETNYESTSDKLELFQLLQKHKIFTPPMGPNLVCKYKMILNLRLNGHTSFEF